MADLLALAAELERLDAAYEQEQAMRPHIWAVGRNLLPFAAEAIRALVAEHLCFHQPTGQGATRARALALAKKLAEKGA